MRGSNRSLKVGKTGRRKDGRTARLKVKKTVSGKYSCLLTLELREHLFTSACGFLECDTIGLRAGYVKNENDLMDLMRHCVLNELVCHKNWLLQNRHDARMLFKRSEAVALIWLTIDSRLLEVVDFRGELHKQLS
jgi:hypothetical protein